MKTPLFFAMLLLAASMMIGCSTEPSDDTTGDAGGDAVQETGEDAADITDSQEDVDVDSPDGETTGDGTGSEPDGVDVSDPPDTTPVNALDLEAVALGPKGTIRSMVSLGDGTLFAVGDNGTAIRSSDAGWSPVDVGTEVDLHGVWAKGPNLIVAVGLGGTIVHFDGTGWETTQLESGVALRAVYGFSESMVYAVGDSGTILFYDGESWELQTSNLPVNLYSVWGSDAQSMFAGGEQAQVLRLVGGEWVSSTVAASGVVVYALWGDGSNQVVAAGSQGAISRWNGVGWKSQTSNDFDGRDLHALWGLDEDTLLAVGNQGTILKYKPGNENWDLTEVKGPFNKQLDLHAVAGSSNVTGTAVGVHAAGQDAGFLALEGNEWVDASGEVQSDLHALWITEDVACVAGDGGLILRRRSSGWTGEFTGTNADLHGLWGTEESLWAVGDEFTVLKREQGEWNALEWPSDVLQKVDLSENYDVPELEGVWSDGTVTFVAGEKGQVYRWEDGAWSKEVTATNFGLVAMWGTSPTNLYAVGQQGTIVHRGVDEIWLKVASGTPHALRRVWGDGEGTVWIVGDFGVLLHGDADGFEQVVDPNSALTTADYLYGVWVAPEGDVISVGFSGLLLQGSAEGFTNMDTGTFHILEAVMGSSADDFFVAGRTGTLLRHRKD